MRILFSKISAIYGPASLKIKLIYILAGTILIVGCKKAFSPPAVLTDHNYLVVEGVINTNGTTTIKLSRTTVIADSVISPKQERNANLTIESAHNGANNLIEIGNGQYITNFLTLSASDKYRLRIKTVDGNEYLSDFVDVKNSPPIDSISFQVVNNQVQVNTNTHDGSNNTRYYRWDYDETWQFTALYESSLISNGSTIVLRTNDIYHCWGNAHSNNIILGSSEKLDKDIISAAPVAFISSSSEKISKRYSMLLKQYALTKEAFSYWQILKKNTETLGSIFDAQPSQSLGNIHNLANPAEPVVGYISAGNVQQKRVFIDKTQLPAEWKPTYPYTCEKDSIPLKNVKSVFIDLPYVYVPLYGLYNQSSLIGYMGAPLTCVDCTFRGTNQRPDFWK